MVCLIAAPFENRGEGFGVRVTTPRIHDGRNVLDAVVELAARGVLRPSDLRENGSGRSRRGTSTPRGKHSHARTYRSRDPARCFASLTDIRFARLSGCTDVIAI